MKIIKKTKPAEHWEEVELTPKEFFSKFKDKELSFIHFHFENGNRWVDEMAWIKENRIYLSSFAGGLVDWSEEKQEYVSKYHGSERTLGQLKKVSMRKGVFDEALEDKQEND